MASSSTATNLRQLERIYRKKLMKTTAGSFLSIVGAVVLNNATCTPSTRKIMKVEVNIPTLDVLTPTMVK